MLFADPFAETILGEDGRRLLAARRGDPAASRRLRAMVVVRALVAERTLAAAVARGCRQYVLLGAGLDTFALRNRTPDLAVFEVDHSATQAMKRARLAEAGLGEPENLHFVPVDFERQELATELVRAGFRFDRPAVFAMLGVVPYVDRAAALATFAVAARAVDATLVFDYSEPWDDAPEPTRSAYAEMAARAASAGEPWVSVWRPDEIAAGLRAAGFGAVDDLSGARLVALGLDGEGHGLVPTLLGHVVVATDRPVARLFP